MVTLNTTFKEKANAAFNNALFNWGKMNPMRKNQKSFIHPSMERLYAAAKELAEIEGKSKVARFFNTLPQNIGRWEDNGVSSEGLLEAQAKLGCNAIWVRDGVGQMRLGTGDSLSGDAIAVAKAFERLTPAQQRAIATSIESYGVSIEPMLRRENELEIERAGKRQSLQSS